MRMLIEILFLLTDLHLPNKLRDKFRRARR